MLTLETSSHLSTGQIIDLIACPNAVAYQAGYNALNEGVRNQQIDPTDAYDALSDAADVCPDSPAERRLVSGMIALLLERPDLSGN
jgi:hypothetical protein